MRRKIAIIDPLGAHGSSFHFYTFGQLLGLTNCGVKVKLYTNNETPTPNFKGVKLFHFYRDVFLSQYKIIKGMRWILGSVLSIFHARFFRVSVFHFHLFHANILVLFDVFLVKLLFGKVVLTVHDVSSFANSSNSPIIGNLIYKFTNLLLTHNEFSKSEILKVNPNLEEYIHIIPHGNYTPFITIQKSKNNSREKLLLPKDKTILLFFGMIKKIKGLDVLLNSLKAIVEKNPDVVLLIAGKVWENDFEIYQNIIDDNNLSDNCILHTRFIPHEDVEHYYCAADMVVLPYKKIYQSGVLMMTLSYERAALVSDLPPLKEVITDNENGFLFKSEDSESLSNRLNEILANREILEKVRVNGTKLITTKYDWHEIGRQTKRAYQTLD